jgi:hypothetical protein
MTAQIWLEFGGHCGIFIKPVPKGKLPTYTFMADLVCYERVSDLGSDMSSLIVCWREMTLKQVCQN